MTASPYGNEDYVLSTDKRSHTNHGYSPSTLKKGKKKVAIQERQGYS